MGSSWTRLYVISQFDVRNGPLFPPIGSMSGKITNLERGSSWRRKVTCEFPFFSLQVLYVTWHKWRSTCLISRVNMQLYGVLLISWYLSLLSTECVQLCLWMSIVDFSSTFSLLLTWVFHKRISVTFKMFDLDGVSYLAHQNLLRS